MGIVTKRGDDRRTDLLGGERVSKADPRLEALGVVDVLNSQLGMARALAGGRGSRCGEVARDVERVQRDLMRICGELAGGGESGTTAGEDVARLEERIQALEEGTQLPRSFIVPGGCAASAAMDMARAISRRLERLVVGLAEQGAYRNDQGLIYLNRLSDYLFLLARHIEKCEGVDFCSEEGSR
jgi:cob(I)alamin adenosyltransferase